MTAAEQSPAIDGLLDVDRPPAHQTGAIALILGLSTDRCMAEIGDAATQICLSAIEVTTEVQHSVDAGTAIPNDWIRRFARDVVRRADDGLCTGIIRILQGHDDMTLDHSLDVALLCMILGRHIGIRSEDDLLLLFQAGLLHDLGKVELPVTLLNKPGPLTAAERTLVKKHPEASARLLAEAGDFDEMLIRAALQHHERIDGSGYPHGLVNGQIDEISRLTAVCDVYCALKEHRAYKPGAIGLSAAESLRPFSGHHLDERLVERMIEVIDG